MTSRSTLITGAIAYDVLLGFEGSFLDTIHHEELESLSVSHFSPHYSKHHGGTGANIAWSLALLGGKPLLVGAVGNDGGEYLALFESRGVDTSRIAKLEDQVTATAIIGTDSAERQIAFFHPGADSHVEWPDLSEDRDDMGMAIVSPRDMRMMIAAMDWCEKYAVPVIFDPGQQIHQFSSDELSRMVRQSAGVIVNEYEWSILRSKVGCTEENIAMLCPFLIITRGDHGATIFDESGAHTIPACKANAVVNPTGAGDAFRAGVLHGLQSGWSLVQSAQLGAAIASFVVEVQGTLLESLDTALLAARAEEVYDQPLPSLA